MALIVVMVGCVAFVMGWIISKVINAPRFYEAGTLAVYHSGEGDKLVCLVQAAYLEQQFMYVKSANSSSRSSIPYFVNAGKVTMYTIDGEAVNEANWNN